jgi:hypothetical protein
MLLLGCGSASSGNGMEVAWQEKLGTNLFEVTALRIALSQHKIQTKYYSIEGNPFV